MLIKPDLHNVADDNTITVVCDQLADLIKILEPEGELSVGWYKYIWPGINIDDQWTYLMNIFWCYCTFVPS